MKIKRKFVQLAQIILLHVAQIRLFDVAQISLLENLRQISWPIYLSDSRSGVGYRGSHTDVQYDIKTY